jgi:hypothetical protein
MYLYFFFEAMNAQALHIVFVFAQASLEKKIVEANCK